VKKLPETTASSESLTKVQEWLNLCHESHKLCQPRAPSVLPKRVLDVSLPQVRLYESYNESGRYVSLSHCWGKTIPACRTTSITIEVNRCGIDWEAFPATFQDAIQFTRRLGLKYIWIDSVCIIQDDAHAVVVFNQIDCSALKLILKFTAFPWTVFPLSISEASCEPQAGTHVLLAC
jgi:hypothetical protein